MRFIRPTETEGLEQLSPIVWRSTDNEGVFFLENLDPALPFVCFFLQAEDEHVAPQIGFDKGDGFDELTAVAFRAFPFGFYHVSLATIGDGVRRLRFRACQGETTFRCLMFQTAQPVFVAILHYLFNLRYQKIGLVAPAPGEAKGRLAVIVSNIARIRTFFTTVSSGGGLRVQQNHEDVLAKVRVAQTMQVQEVRDAMASAMQRRDGVPLLSFVAPVYNTKPEHLRDLLASFEAEEALYAELILVDDGSPSAVTKDALTRVEPVPGVKVVRLAQNGGIAVASNAGIAAARGEWVAFIDHDDAFVAGAIAVIAKAIGDHPAADFFYTDEIITNAALKLTGCFCKPAYDSVLLSGMNYINHFSVFRRARLNQLGGIRLDCEGSQDYDLLLRYLAGARPEAVVHIPFLAYTWRRGEESYSAVFRERSVGNARRALQRAYAVGHDDVTVEAAINPDLHRVRFPRAARQLVSIVIPNRNSRELIKKVVADLQTRTDYPDIEIVIPDNGTTDPEVARFYAAKASDRFRVEIVPEDFNFARMCNRGVRMARGDALLFLNNDIEVMEPGWLTEMVECLSYPSTGIVGAKLLFPNGNIQHVGVIPGLGEAAGHWFDNDPADEPGPQGRLAVRQTIGAVTGACMLVTRACFDAVGGFDEVAFAIAYNDVDFCLRARQVGFRTVWTPFATLLHHESATRGSDDVGENNVRFRREFVRLQERHATKTHIDDAYSPFYDRRYARPHLILQPELPATRGNLFT